MPSTSSKQRRAMEAAASGHGNLGIPVSVAREFRAADRAKLRGKASKKRPARKNKKK